MNEPLEPERTERLRSAKLTAMVHSSGAEVSGEVVALGSGSATVVDGLAWVLWDSGGGDGLGPVLLWAARNSLEGIRVVVPPEGSGVWARRAGYFATPVEVLRLEGTSLVPVDPAPFDPPARVPDSLEPMVELIAASGADVVVEHGELSAEVAGLEVARVVVAPNEQARIEVGVGRNDREVFSVLRADADPAEALARAVELVASHRGPASTGHPMGRLAPERWLRSVLVARPDLVGADYLVPDPPLRPRRSIAEGGPASASGATSHGDPVVVVASVGVDPDLVPHAADLRARDGRQAELRLVVSERDAYDVTRRLVEDLREPAQLVTVPDRWRELTSGARES